MVNPSQKSVVNKNRAQEVRNDIDQKIIIKYDENAANICHHISVNIKPIECPLHTSENLHLKQTFCAHILGVIVVRISLFNYNMFIIWTHLADYIIMHCPSTLKKGHNHTFSERYKSLMNGCWIPKKNDSKINIDYKFFTCTHYAQLDLTSFVPTHYPGGHEYNTTFDNYKHTKRFPYYKTCMTIENFAGELSIPVF